MTKIAFVTMLCCATTAFAQRAVDVRGKAGVAVFADDSADVHRDFGGSARFYLTQRFAIEPEIAYLHRDSSHHDWLFMPNVSWDFRSMENRVVPYVIGGVGWLRTKDEFFGGSTFSGNSWIAEGGAGVKVYLNRNVFVSPEFRVGSELHVRFGGSIGYTFGR